MKPDVDIIIVGGGIQGAGVAQIAALNGYSVLLLEKAEVGSGTSSKSSKLIHGGLRYLESFQFSLVRECLQERSLLLKIAPDLVKLQPFYLPIYRQSHRSSFHIHVGLQLYRWLTGNQPGNNFQTVPPAEWTTLDGLKTEHLQVVFQYWDAQTNDQLLTKAVMASAIQQGAELREHCEVTAIEIQPNAVQVAFEWEGRKLQKQAKILINCAGPWVNQLLTKVSPAIKPIPLSLVQGTHILLDLPSPHGMYYLEAPSDQRAVFVMPWEGKTLVGTTETLFTGNPDDAVPLPAEIHYLQETFAHYFPGKSNALLHAFAGLRVLPASTKAAFHRPREAIIVADQLQHPKILTLVGGKLTSYRVNAQNLFQEITKQLPRKMRLKDTSNLSLTSPIGSL